jgi:hypothetical protein
LRRQIVVVVVAVVVAVVVVVVVVDVVVVVAAVYVDKQHLWLKQLNTSNSCMDRIVILL